MFKVPLTTSSWRRDFGLLSHPTDWRTVGSKQRPLNGTATTSPLRKVRCNVYALQEICYLLQHKMFVSDFFFFVVFFFFFFFSVFFFFKIRLCGVM